MLSINLSNQTIHDVAFLTMKVKYLIFYGTSNQKVLYLKQKSKFTYSKTLPYRDFVAFDTTSADYEGVFYGRRTGPVKIHKISKLIN